jgi:hypothetical protein
LEIEMANQQDKDKDKQHPQGGPPGQQKPKPGDPDYQKPGQGGGSEGGGSDDEPYVDHRDQSNR